MQNLFTGSVWCFSSNIDPVVCWLHEEAKGSMGGKWKNAPPQRNLPEQVWNRLLRIKRQIFLFSTCTKCDFKYTADIYNAVSQSFWAIANKARDTARTNHWEVEDVKFKLRFLNVRLMNSSTKYQENKQLILQLSISRHREDDTCWKKCSSKLLALCYQLSAGVSK